jgi:hypothetical protein
VRRDTASPASHRPLASKSRSRGDGVTVVKTALSEPSRPIEKPLMLPDALPV